MSRPSAPPEAVNRFRQQLSALTDAAGGGPLDACPDANLDKRPDEHIAVAVSGGPDSLALLLLAHAAYPGRVLALTVDHDLRPESADEAKMVAELCTELGVGHQTLAIADLKTKKANVQARARTARYAAMMQQCANAGVRFLLTAHHADDQAETVLMRLVRGSGLGGLAGIRARRAEGGIIILRPLLGFRKSELMAIVSDAGLVAADDPSNRSDAYDRTAVRALLTKTPLLDPLRIAAAASHLADAEAALQWMTEQAWRGRMEWQGRTILLDLDDLPHELVRRLAARAIVQLNADAKMDGPSLKRLVQSIDKKRDSTLGGIQISYGRRWRFAVAPPRRDENRTFAHCS